MNPLYQIDQNLFRLFHVDMHQDWLDPIMILITDSGRGEVKFLVLLVICFIVKYRRFALMALTAGIVSGLFSQLFKQLVGRDRPSNYEFASPLTTYIEALSGQNPPYGATSFPSGHATSCFAIAVAIAWVVRKTDYAWLGWVLVGWATLVGFSRVYVGVHFVSDVIAGAALGSIVGTGFWMFWKKKGWLKP